MPRANESLESDKDFTLAGPINHRIILFLMIRDINRAAFTGDDISFFRGVDTLESNIPKKWENEEYKKALKRIQTEAEQDKLITRDKNKMSDILYEYTQKKLRLIIDLLDKRGKLGEKQKGEFV